MKPVVSSPTLALNALIKGWKFNKKYIKAIFEYFNSSFDQTDNYLDGMDGEGVTHPKDYWKIWCRGERIMHESDNNPFLNI